MSRTISLNGQLLPESEARVSVYDLSVCQSAAVFEMTRSFRGVHFKLREHLERLQRSCAALGIGLTQSLDELEAMCHDVTARNDHGEGHEHRLMIVASPGCASIYRDIEGVVKGPYVYISDFPLSMTTSGMGRQFTHGGTAIISSIQQVPDACVPSWAKHRSRLHFHLAQEEAKRKGADWAILLTAERVVTECPGANLFLVHDGVLSTPAAGCLRGISRATVMDLAVQCGVFCYERTSGPRTLLDAEEVFVSGTPFCLLPIVKIGDQVIGDGTPGPVYTRLLAAWSENVGISIADQIISWDNVFHAV